MAIIIAVVDLAMVAALMLGAGRPDDARVLCRDPWRGYLSADMPLTSVTQTPGGWVLYFPRGGLSSGRNVEVWQECEVSVAHVAQDLHQARWETVPPHDLLLASPCCQGHSRARGKDRPGSDASRSTAWAVVSCAEYHRPKVAIVENVPEFLSWVLFPAWSASMRALGYSLAPHIIDAADCGVPQHRERLFIVATRSAAPLDLGRPDVEHSHAADIVDFDDGVWSQVDTDRRSPATLRRVANGRASFGERFVMPYYGSGSGLTGRSLARPLGTVTTRDRWALVDGDRMRMLTVGEYRAAMGFPATYRLPVRRHEAIHMLGNAVAPPAAAWVIGRVLEAA